MKSLEGTKVYSMSIGARSVIVTFILLVGMFEIYRYRELLGQQDLSSVHQLMKSRYTVRTFDSEKPVKLEHIEQFISIGRLSPSKNNLWPYRIVVLTDSPEGQLLKDKIWKKYSGCTNCLIEDGRPVYQRIHSIKTAPLNMQNFT